MKKLLLASLMIAAIPVTSAFADDQIKIGFSNRTMNGAFFNAMDQYMKKHTKEHGYEYISTDARNDLTKQMSDVEDMLSQGIDYLVLNPQDPEAGLRIAKNAERKGVPVIVLDSGIPLSAPVITRVQADNQKNNIMLGEYAVDQYGSEPMNCVLVSGNQGNVVGEMRRVNFMRGVMEAQLRKYNQTNLTILSQGWGGWDQQGGLKAMEDLLVAHGDKVNCAFAENDEMALGVILSLKASNKLDEVRVFSNDGYKKGLESIKRGDIMATVGNNPNQLTEKVVEVISEHAAGETQFPDYSYIKPVLMTKTNINDHLDPESFF
ncbi:substrate-binding domain-containing protein [Vibrio crassostreae]|uniref:substrate-binding domain-containing protein n=1 Tax=Vibrio crassostreae TaxID=246167 RepID=UPI00104A1BFF|nr:substrate-binding domain-containing protein [Vibrio crassostreae]TCN97478.1 monosaccharide ABC transporter substrate-binding protein (CUT2 family) [Vibrio crassostreae]CAK1746298.1 ribose transport system substrate-binding protein [Vibrio crassostreae]CAK1753373.1 ribose transport system substrate-binding protein [Vibrio crassostreae]CAK1766243.1 ribose transport system substrate-binding protein [Vibrio crassostreae]CAK2548734.1 ribose transport system substrate-binding protein [Vibrio cras